MITYKNILFINYGGIGDEILFLPTIKSVKERYPNARITLALEPRSQCIADLCPFIDAIIPVDIKAGGLVKYFNILKFIFMVFAKYDLVISSGKSPFVALILFLMGIKERIGYCSKWDFLLTKKIPLNERQYAAKMYHDLVKPVSKFEFQNPEIIVDEAFELNKSLKKNEYICIHPGVSKMSISKNIFKCPNVAFWSELIKGLLKKNKQVVLLGTKDDKDLLNEILAVEEIRSNPDFIDYYNKTKNIMEMAFIMKNSSCVICVDSAPMHVAAAVGAKLFAIFGPTNEKKLLPEQDNITVIHNGILCRPCLWDRKLCNCEDSSCLDIDPNLILDNIN